MLNRFIKTAIKYQQPAERLIQRFTASNTTTAVTNSPSKEKWDLLAGILVERLPVISKELNELEKKFQEYLWRVEFENSLKSNHEIQNEQDIRQVELLKTGQIEIDLDESASKQTAQDLKDMYTEELKNFKFATRTTVDDKANKLTSTNRCLDETLYLLMEHKLGKQIHFLLPQGQRQDGETMRQTAERVLREKCGETIQVQFYGNAPAGFYKYKYPADMRQSSIGAKVFFFRAALQKGNVDDKTKKDKYEWLHKSALQNKFKNINYMESVKKFLI